MIRRRRLPPRTWPIAAILLYSLGLLAVLAVSLSLGGEETSPAPWALVTVPALLFAAASIVVRRTSARPAAMSSRSSRGL
jgi:peptidoglycan/LPS O-acetylase OafA/YrhL